MLSVKYYIAVQIKCSFLFFIFQYLFMKECFDKIYEEIEWEKEVSHYN